MRKIAPAKGRAKEKRGQEMGDFKKCVTTAENTGTQPRSAPRWGAKSRAKTREKPKGKEECGR